MGKGLMGTSRLGGEGIAAGLGLVWWVEGSRPRAGQSVAKDLFVAPRNLASYAFLCLELFLPTPSPHFFLPCLLLFQSYTYFFFLALLSLQTGSLSCSWAPFSVCSVLVL